MTVHSVTARSTGTPSKAAHRIWSKFRNPRAQRMSRIAPVQRYRPRYLQGIPLRTANTGASRAAVRRLVLSLVGRASPLPVAALIGTWMYYNRKVAPPGFPGFDSIDPGWRKPLVEGVALGDYAPNPFDHGDFDNPPESLVDVNTCEIPFGCIYWGDFGAEPYPVPLPGLNWPVITQAIQISSPSRTSRSSNVLGNRVRYRSLPNLVIGVNDLIIDDGLTDNVVISIPLPPISPSATAPGRVFPAREVKIGKNAPRKKTLLERKVRPKNIFIWLVLKKIANAGGEAKEWIDILAEAADYEGWKARGFDRVPLKDVKLDLTRPWHFREVGSIVPTGIVRTRADPRLADIARLPDRLLTGGLETQQKAYYLFVLNGLDSIDWELLARLAVENEIEDFIYGRIGRMSKSAAQGLGMTVGPQTGLVM